MTSRNAGCFLWSHLNPCSINHFRDLANESIWKPSMVMKIVTALKGIVAVKFAYPRVSTNQSKIRSIIFLLNVVWLSVQDSVWKENRAC